MRELKSEQPGYFEIFLGAGDSGWYFQCKCPCGCRYNDSIPLHKAGDPPSIWEKYWEWDGNLTRPTLTPSMRRHTPCAIHFNVTAGKYVWHADSPTPLAPNVYSSP